MDSLCLEFIKEANNSVILSLEEERRHMKEYKTTQSEAAKHILIKSCYKIVLSIARRFYSFNPDVDFMDLVQYGFLGLLDALEKDDLEND